MKVDFTGLFTTKSRDKITFNLAGNPTFWPVSLKSFFNQSEENQEKYLSGGYAGNPYIFMVVDRIASVSARLHRKYVDQTREGAEVTATEIDALLEKPNQRDDKEEFYYRMYANYLVCGETFIHGIAPVGFTKYAELVVPIVPYVQINTNGRGGVNSYSYSQFGNAYANIDPADMLHIKRPDITQDEHHGLSALRPGTKIYKADNELRDAKASIFHNRGASRLLYMEDARGITPIERENIQKQLDKDTLGGNRDKAYVAPTKIGHVPLSMDGAMMRALDNEGLNNLRDACRIFAVDPIIFGDTAGSTYNNEKEGKAAFYTEAVLPLCNKIDTSLSKWLIQKNYGMANVVYEVDESQIEALQSVNREQAETLEIDIRSGIITVEEARALRYPELGALPAQQQNNEGTTN